MTLKEWRLWIENELSKANIDNVSLEAKWFLAAALQRENAFIALNPTYTPSFEEEQKIKEWLRRRCKGEPLSRLKGFREFWSLPFHLNEHTLDPRPESECIIKGVLCWVGDRVSLPWRILDLGTGSGCLLITLLHELNNAAGVGIDINENALTMARKNAILNKVAHRAKFCLGNWCEGLKGSFDIIVSNPPYIPLKEKDFLSKEVAYYDPHQALFGGIDGLRCYRHLSHGIKAHLSPQGLAIFEIGMGQRENVTSLFQDAGFNLLFTLQDLAEIDRVVAFAAE